MSKDQSPKTEQATQRKLQKSREKGQVPRSREVGAALSMALFLLAAYLAGPYLVERGKQMISASLLEAPLTALTHATINMALQVSVRDALLLMAPLLGALLLSVGLASAVQGGPVFASDPLKLNFSRLNPMQALKPILTGRKGMEALQATFKGTVFVLVAWSALQADMGKLVALSAGSAAEVLRGLCVFTGRILGRMTIAGLLLAVADLAWQHWRFHRDQRMSKQEVKQERKESEGDPLVRGKIRARMQAISRRRMMEEVKKASVVVVNPVHVAVALRYDPRRSPAPLVVAKGRERMARRIREMARTHRVPVVTDAPLARLLEQACVVGQEVPQALYRAVAGVLAFVMRRRRGEKENYRRALALPTDLPLGPAALRAMRRALRRQRRPSPGENA